MVTSDTQTRATNGPKLKPSRGTAVDPAPLGPVPKILSAPSGADVLKDHDNYQRVIASHARTSFHFASRFLPEDRRQATVTLYSFYRTLDNLVDEPCSSVDPQQIQLEINAWRAWFEAPVERVGPREPLASNVRELIEQYEIPQQPFLDFLSGLEHDLHGREVVDQQDLQRYCYQVASTVGIAMTHILGATSPEALMAASRLGAAMQLTNILRDVGEDLAAGRVYLPTETLEAYDLSRLDIERMMTGQKGTDARFRTMMRSQVALARSWYRLSLSGIWQLPRESRFPILVASRLYRRLLTNIEKASYDTLHVDVSTSRWDKLREAAVSSALVKMWSYDE